MKAEDWGTGEGGCCQLEVMINSCKHGQVRAPLFETWLPLLEVNPRSTQEPVLDLRRDVHFSLAGEDQVLCCAVVSLSVTANTHVVITIIISYPLPARVVGAP